MRAEAAPATVGTVMETLETQKEANESTESNEADLTPEKSHRRDIAALLFVLKKVLADNYIMMYHSFIYYAALGKGTKEYLRHSLSPMIHSDT